MDPVSVCVASTYLVSQVKAMSFSHGGAASAPEGSSVGLGLISGAQAPFYPGWVDAHCNQL